MRKLRLDMTSTNHKSNVDSLRRNLLKTAAVSTGGLLLNLPLSGCGGSTNAFPSPSSLSSLVLATGSFGRLERAWNTHHQLLLTRPDGTSFTFGSASASQTDVNSPTAAAVSSDGSFWITDTGNSRLLHLSNSLQVLGSITSIAGVRLRSPSGISMLPDGRIVVTDTGLGIAAVTDNTGSGKWFGLDVADQISPTWQPNWTVETNHSILDNPKAIAVSPDSSIAILDTAAKRIVLFSPNFVAVNSLLIPGNPSGLAISPNGDYYVADHFAKTVFSFNKSSPSIIKSIELPTGLTPRRLIWKTGADASINNLFISSLT